MRFLYPECWISMLVFVKGGKLEKPERPSGWGKSQQQTQPTNGTGPELNQWHIVRRCVLSPPPYHCPPLATGHEMEYMIRHIQTNWSTIAKMWRTLVITNLYGIAWTTIHVLYIEPVWTLYFANLLHDNILECDLYLLECGFTWYHGRDIGAPNHSYLK